MLTTLSEICKKKDPPPQTGHTVYMLAHLAGTRYFNTDSTLQLLNFGVHSRRGVAWRGVQHTETLHDSEMGRLPVSRGGFGAE